LVDALAGKPDDELLVRVELDDVDVDEVDDDVDDDVDEDDDDEFVEEAEDDSELVLAGSFRSFKSIS
jgi:hypothetical protein